MPLLERIRKSIFGDDTAATNAPEDRDAAYDPANDRSPNVSTPVDDPIMDDVAAQGVQPVSKPREIEAAQNPQRTPLPLDD